MYHKPYASCDNRDCGRAPLALPDGSHSTDGWYSIDLASDITAAIIDRFSLSRAEAGALTACCDACLVKLIPKIHNSLFLQKATEILQQQLSPEEELPEGWNSDGR